MRYIQRKDRHYLETVDEFETLKEARAMCREYQFGDQMAVYYVSSRPCRDWHESTNTMTRQEIEHTVISHLLIVMREHGWAAVKIDDGGDEWVDVESDDDVINTVFSVDDCTIVFRKGKIERVALIVLGNGGWDCIADHSMSKVGVPEDDFEETMNEVYGFCEELA